jgi:hypothetical protein
MVHKTKKKALYEVILGSGTKSSFEQLHPKRPEIEPAKPPETVSTAKPATGGQEGPQVEDVAPPSVVRWIKKPRLLQFNAGRVEFSIPYQLGIAILLGALLVVVVVYRLGENLGSRESPKPTVVKQTIKPDFGQTAVSKPAAAAAADTTRQAAADAARQGIATGKNRIVIKIYQVQSHLEPVKEYFDKLGVPTEIIERNNWYYLVTKNKYDNPDKPGTDGYLARQKIIELGAGYKAPPGHETFGPKPFSDAFGMRFEE